MPNDTTPRDDDETLALPVTDQEAAADETLALPVTDQQPAADETLALPVTDQETAADETLALPVSDHEPAPDPTRPLPVTDAPGPGYTSPIGTLFGPPEPTAPRATVPPDAVQPDAVQPDAVQAGPADEPRRRLRVGTVVWGLIIAAIGVGLLAWAAGFEIDLQLAMIVLLAVAGTALLVGSILSGARNARR